MLASLAFTVSAMYRLEQLGDPSTFSPSGRYAAFVVKRPLHEERNMAQAFLEDDDNADVYIADLRTGTARRITDGSADGTGFWDPQWSPDGKRIAMLSTRGGNVFLWIWDAAHGLRRVTDRALNAGYENPGFTWAGDERIVCQVLPAGKKPLSMTVEYETPLVAMREWPLEWRGRVSTANVLESGVAADVATRPQGELLDLDFANEHVRTSVLARAVAFADVTVSPDHRYVATLEAVGILHPRAGRRLQSDFDNTIYEPAIYDLRSGMRVAHFPSRFVGAAPMRWSSAADAIALMGEPATTEFKSHLGIYRCGVAARHCIDVLPVSLDIDLGPNGAKRAPLWAPNAALLVYAHAAGESIEKARWDWYAIGSRNVTNLTASLENAPASLVAVEGGRRFVFVSGGSLMRLSPGGSPAFSHVAGSPSGLTGIVWPSSADTGSATIVLSRGEQPQQLLAFDVASRSITQLARLRDAESLNAFTPQNLELVTVQNARDGSFLRYSEHGGSQRTLYAANTWLSRYGEGRLVHYAYTGQAGEHLTAWILLPPQYVPTHRYPAVVWVYAGSVMSAAHTPYLASLNLVHALNLQLLAAQGYAVIFPSMPLPPFGVPSDPYTRLTDGVLPAVTRAVQLGYVDTHRIAVMGQSYGGFSTYGLIEQTSRFKAAIALAGISDWTSLYGTFDARQRYRDNVNEADEFSEELMEDGQGNFGAPPWVDPARYERNSPLTYAAAVHTPLLIVQGDLDYVSITQGEEFFTALYRQGKRAEFVRYWGEDHVLRSEANIADCWRRIGAWLREFLR